MKYNKNNSQDGYALLVIVILFAIVMGASVTNIVFQNLVWLKNEDSYSAIRSGENTALSTISPIKRDISTQIDNKLSQLLKTRMTDFLQHKITTCQVVIPDENIDKIDQQFSLCDPVNLLNNLQGASKKSIDFLKYAVPQQIPAGNGDAQWQLRELQRENQNEFDYTIETAYVGSQLVQEASSSRPRVEMYRYLVQSNVTTHTYGDIYYAMRHNFDVSIIVSIVGNSNIAPCDNAVSNDGSGAFLVGFEKCETNLATGLQDCIFVPINTPQYNSLCTGTCPSNLHAAAAGKPYDPAALDGKAPITIGGNARYLTNCVTGGVGTQVISGKRYAANWYNWQIVVRPVGFGSLMF